MVDIVAAVARLEVELGCISPTENPYEHALAAQRLGLAYAESVGQKPEERLRQALACFDLAANLLDPRFHPVEHARVLTAAGSVRRSLGEPATALHLFRAASALAAGRISGDEAAAMGNNIGLAQLETGDVAGAIAAFDEAVAGFDKAFAEGRRGAASALHNRALAKAASGRTDDLVAALADHDLALAIVGFDEAPLHHGLVHHSRGVAASNLSQAATDPDAANSWRREAIAAFTTALDVFVWPEHAMHHGIVSFNLGRMLAAGTEITDQRRAMLSLEDAVTAFDPRAQSTAWRQAYDALSATDARLAERHQGWRRSDHLVALLHEDNEAAGRLMRRRLTRWLVLPAPARDAALADFVAAASRVGEAHGSGASALRYLLTTAVELPVEAQSIVLDGLLATRVAADPTTQDILDRLVDQAIGEALNGPQRVFVRDHLTAGGFERP